MIVTIKESKFKIRNCKDEDYRFVYNLLKKNMYSLVVKHWGSWNPKMFRAHFNKKNIKIVECQTKKVAFCDFEFKENFSYINDVQVSTLMQGKGLGTFLMDLMEKETKRQGLRKIRLRVFKDNKAKKLYYKLGYKTIKDDKSSIVLEKKL